jgi:mannose-6-phosphate isomerase-like protein (cupin superfamily)
MRFLKIAMDEHGRSRLESAAEIVPSAVPGMHSPLVASLFATSQSPPPARTPSVAHHTDTRLPPGHLRWMVIDHLPFDPSATENSAAELHATDAIDLVYVVSGTATFVLDDGEHEIRAGDCIVMAGAPHGQRAGAEGCRMLAASIGTPPVD